MSNSLRACTVNEKLIIPKFDYVAFNNTLSFKLVINPIIIIINEQLYALLFNKFSIVKVN